MGWGFSHPTNAEGGWYEVVGSSGGVLQYGFWGWGVWSLVWSEMGTTIIRSTQACLPYLSFARVRWGVPVATRCVYLVIIWPRGIGWNHANEAILRP